MKAKKTISATCEVKSCFVGICGKPTSHAYEAMGGGWMALCHEHAQPHLRYAKPIDELTPAEMVKVKRG